MTFEEDFPELHNRGELIRWIKGKVKEGHADDVADTMLQMIHRNHLREVIGGSLKRTKIIMDSKHFNEKEREHYEGYSTALKEVMVALGL